MSRIAIIGVTAICLFFVAGCKTTSTGGGSVMSGTSVVAQRPMLDMSPAEKTAEARAKIHVDLGMAYVEIGKYDVALDEANAALAENSAFAPAA